MLTFTVTFVQSTNVTATYVHIGNILAVTDPVLIKLLGPILWGLDIFWTNHFFVPQIDKPMTQPQGPPYEFLVG